MASNTQEYQNVQKPDKSAAIHFGCFLQLGGFLQGGNNQWGSIEKQDMLEVFINDYQPLYKTSLLCSTLLQTLCKFEVAKRRTRRKKGKGGKSIISILKHSDPSRVMPPATVGGPRTCVDQTRIMREPIARSEPMSDSGCKLCNETFSSQQEMSEHLDSDPHGFRLQYRSNRSSFKSEVGGVSVSMVAGTNDTVARVGDSGRVIVGVTLQQEYQETKVYEIFRVDGISVDKTVFRDNEPIQVTVSAQFSDLGAYLYPLVFKIMPCNICVMKDLTFQVGSNLIDHIGPVSPYTHQRDISIREMEGSILPGESCPKGVSKLGIRVGLQEHKINPAYTKLLLHKLMPFNQMKPKDEKCLKQVLGLLCGQLTYKEAVAQVTKKQLPYTAPLSPDTYTDRFQLLLDFEEMQELRQVKNYDQTSVSLEKVHNKFLLKLQDLSEGRPSVKTGDSVHIKLLDFKDKVIFEGIIHEMREQGLLLGLHTSFAEQYNNLKKNGVEPKVDVRFKLSRYCVLHMHRALRLLKKHNAVPLVFPSAPQGYFPPTATQTLRPWVNPLIANNPEQQLAVVNIVSRTENETAPYIIYGPPGTGKTVTLVETIAQVWYANQTNNTVQLVCAPSNEASNNIALRLLTMLPRTSKILRLFAMSIEVIKVPEKLRQHSNYDSATKKIAMPSLEEISDHHIIVVTLISAGRLVSAGAKGMFKYVYIDECGQATEPEVLIPIAGLITSQESSCSGHLVLAGDPQQLGPILSSQLAKDFGLGMSLLERLMTGNPLYQKRSDGSGYNPKYITKLVQNFRSHRAILTIPNQLFYDNELIERSNPDITNVAVGWSELPNKAVPMLFHGVQGLDERESSSPSYFNRLEIDVVISYISKLLTKGLHNYKIKPEDIGVITPYRKQVRKFEKIFDMLKWKISVGSVEFYQGSEKLIVFISTVRSTIALVDEDYKFKLGFLKNPKRFNVSVTRAKALLVMVGNPNILRHDYHWYQLLKHCRDNGMYRGINIPEGEPPKHQGEHIAT